MKKRLSILALCLVLLVSMLALTACDPKRTVEQTYSVNMAGWPTEYPVQWQIRLKIEVDIRTKTVKNVTWQPIMVDGEDKTYLSIQPDLALNNVQRREEFLLTLANTSFALYKGLTPVIQYRDYEAPSEHLEQFNIYEPDQPTKVSKAFVIDAVGYILKQNRFI